jgi:hypothetical protein
MTTPTTHTAAQHTPGPWKAKERHANYSGWVVLHETGNGLRRVDDKEGVFSEANARLIAAAPQMLAALRRYVDCDGYDDAIKQQAIEAIRAAEGR